ncbi:hypothetical protein C9J48_17550 [Photobacterium profundum]|uniref:Outer membrane protein beta-barrel domain-containing protein n=1 Tax=Photobacterium profundum 3TCK TaxID=314280 RepID=Q1Z319_9GAMM|nr:hypothetical protein [Photobacterium profundum]EAS42970.1 hypothetical protein P3TCK_14183 [Photobacterium profundum 3TCK]PSV60940.1 hypothetical protein C9J48_17550 [Photobacterium profundum]
MRLINTVMLLTSLPIFSVYAKEDSQENIDMSDPTAVYSAVGISLNSEQNVDISGSVAWDNNQLLVETNNGANSLGLTYAYMEEGSGLYAEADINTDLRSYSVGGVTTLEATDCLKFYPVAMLGFINDETTEDSTAITTLGTYTRYTIGKGLHLGLDAFYILGTQGYDDYAVDAFLGYQYQRHRLRLGIDQDEEIELEYKIAFF